VDDGLMTPTELAVELWGPSQANSRAWGPRHVRVVARTLFGNDAPGQGGDWRLSREQADEIRRALANVSPPTG
jgi:hypothetical protein